MALFCQYLFKNEMVYLLPLKFLCLILMLEIVLYTVLVDLLLLRNMVMVDKCKTLPKSVDTQFSSTMIGYMCGTVDTFWSSLNPSCSSISDTMNLSGWSGNLIRISWFLLTFFSKPRRIFLTPFAIMENGIFRNDLKINLVRDEIL